jgi:hypothetical protein
LIGMVYGEYHIARIFYELPARARTVHDETRRVLTNSL